MLTIFIEFYTSSTAKESSIRFMNDQQRLMNNRQNTHVEHLDKGVSEKDLLSGVLGFVSHYNLETPEHKGLLLEGVFSLLQAPSGIKIHAVDAIATEDLSSNFIVPPSFSVTVFLGGFSQVYINGCEVKYGTQPGQPHIQIQYNTDDMQIDRRSTGGKHMRKVNISLKGDALNSWIEAGFDFKVLCSEERFENVFFHEFSPSTEITTAAEAIISIGNEPNLREQIELERLALKILDGILQIDPSTSQEKHFVKAQQARQYIDEHLTENLSLSTLAKDLGMSVSNFQRSFKLAFG
ncbi:MAG: AraC family transcriptional regulator, partial [Pseudomonadota bacterium]